MAIPSLTYTLTNGATADASQVMQNLNDIINGVTDGSKDLSINALTCAGTATLNGTVNLGNASADDLSISASLASTLAIKTDDTYNIGSPTLRIATMHAHKYYGTKTNDSAGTGEIGEYIESIVSTPTNYPGATNAWGDTTSISLTAGDWDVTLIVETRLNGASNSAECLIGISATSGNSATGLTRGSNYFGGTQGTAQANQVYTIANYRVSLSSTTTYYGKIQTAYTAGNPAYLCRLSARRVR